MKGAGRWEPNVLAAVRENDPGSGRGWDPPILPLSSLGSEQ